MNGKIIALALLAFVLVVAVSGCTTVPDGTTVSDQVTAQQENEVINELDTELISEDEEVEIGEMI